MNPAENASDLAAKTPAPEIQPPLSSAALSALVEDLLPSGPTASEMNRALPAVYEELRAMAANYLRRERSDHTLQPTALVHESYLRLLNQRTVDWSNRLEFLSIVARMMRRILADHAGARAAEKRGGGAPKLQLDAALDFCNDRAIDVAVVDHALRDLEAMDPRQARLVELRFFGGLTIDETAEVMAISPATVKREWMTARRWLQRELSAA
ncbi:MAG: ECF-type sigma factor [Chthoniobacterales bacterium]